ncbi:hypothetical protein C5E45_32110 [Nocardia nova]|uniref:Uncharacterized protein n=1 Tax=Nocardia nova TaxID=37330 RepID=A0A2S6AE60_9NOCA|nr:hypothetical protein [Nocardia nova]PPJ22747.1 hypothetical protein C5E41_26195 [Nocardia nova]PPJ32729.1 hypothetical protein C5E45_32110 [Nocardia nova]
MNLARRTSGRIAIGTSHRPRGWVGQVSNAVGGAGGLRVFDLDTFPKLFAEYGLVDIEQEVHGLLQDVSARAADAA